MKILRLLRSLLVVLMLVGITFVVFNFTGQVQNAYAVTQCTHSEEIVQPGDSVQIIFSDIPTGSDYQVTIAPKDGGQPINLLEINYAEYNMIREVTIPTDLEGGYYRLQVYRDGGDEVYISCTPDLFVDGPEEEDGDSDSDEDGFYGPLPNDGADSSAGDETGSGETGGITGLSGVTDVISFGSVGGIITKLLPFIFGLGAMIALLFFLFGGIRYMLARGDPKQVDAARGTITSAIIGLLIIIFSITIFYFIGQIFKIDIFSSIFSSKVYATEGINIGEEVRLVGGSIGNIFPTAGSLFTNIVRALLAVAAIVFLVIIVWGGFLYLNSGGNPDNTERARGNITGAIIGLLIVVVSFAIIELLLSLTIFGDFENIFR